MKYFLLAAVMLLMSCKKEDVSPQEQIIGTWYYIGYEDEDGVFTPYELGRKTEYKFEKKGGYQEYYYWANGSGWNLGGPWQIRDDNRLYLDSDEDWRYIKFKDGKLKKAHWWGENPMSADESWAVYEH